MRYYVNREQLKLSVVCLMLVLAPVWAMAQDVLTASKGKWTVTYDKGAKTFSFQKAGKVLIAGSNPTVTYDNAEGASRTVTSSDFANVELTQTRLSDTFGNGECFTFSFSGVGNGDAVTMQQHVYIYDSRADYVLTDLNISGDASIKSNYLAPISVSSPYTLLDVSSADNRMLRVPFDNDDYDLRYGMFKLTQSMRSYEVSAIFEGASRHGLVLGSVDHDHWKSAVDVTATGNNPLSSLKIFSGVSDSNTRDQLPHGKLDGPTITSARMFVGWFDDWRDGMDEFGRANTTIAPKRDTWKYGTPFGWQSWGVMQDKNSYTADTEIADYYQNTLVPGGFSSPAGGPTIISVDAWDNLSEKEWTDLAARHKGDQIVGNYNSPYSLWYDDNTSYTTTMWTDPLGKSYTWDDVLLKANGKYIQINSGQKCYAKDPTHPYTIQEAKNFVRNGARKGIKYMKWDFLNNGITQADSYYKRDIKTAVEAYNYGMSEVMKVADEYGIFIAWSIAPLFPYRYANSRRIACDTYSDITATEYSMNAVGGGWWTDELFQFNDPDHLVMINRDWKKVLGVTYNEDTEGENRARYTNGIVTGLMLVADNFSTSQTTPGNSSLARERAQKIMLNKDVNEIARTGKTFRPVYGYKGYNGGETDAENFFMYHTPDYLYVAVINYKNTTINGTLSGNLPLSDLGITAAEVGSVKELWSGNGVSLSGENLPYSVSKADACIYRLSKAKGLTFKCDKAADRDMFSRSHRTAPLVADFDNDGYMDFYYGGTSNKNGWQPQAVLAKGNGNGFDCIKDTGLPFSSYGIGSKVLDFNNDGLVDLLVVSEGGNDTGQSAAYVLVKNEGNNKFSVVNDAALASIADINYGGERRFNEMAGFKNVSVCDYNKDGYPDLLIQDWAFASPDAQGSERNWMRVTKLLKNIDGDHFEIQDIGLSQMSGASVSFGDFNCDGWPDIFANGYNNGWEAHIYLNQKDGTFKDADLGDLKNKLIFDQKKREAKPFVMDFNQDGRIDIVVVGRFGTENTKSRFLLFENQSENNSLSFTTREVDGFYPVGDSGEYKDNGETKNHRLFLASLADFNGDARPDYIGYGYNSTDAKYIYSMSASSETGYSSWKGEDNPGIALGEGCTSYADLNGDGLMDIVSSNWDDDADQIYYNVNTTPAAPIAIARPADPVTSYNKETKQLTVTWTATENENGTHNMYNLYLKDAESGKVMRMLAPARLEDGKLTANMEFCNYVPGNTYTFEGVEEGHYIIGIQSVTCGWNASAFVTMEVYTATTSSDGLSFACDSEADKTTFPRSYRICPLVADFNGDGIMDVYYGGTSWKTGWNCPTDIVYGGTDGFTVAENVSGLPKTSYGQGSKAFDFDQDGHVDFIFMNTGANNGDRSRGYVLVKNNGDGTFTTLNDAALGSITVAATDGSADNCKFNDKAQVNALSIADYNKDGYPDLLIQNLTDGGGFTKVLKNINGERFEIQDIDCIHQVYGGAVAFADLNGDGWADIISHGKNSEGLYEVQLYRNTKDGNFALATPDWPDGESLSYYMSIHSNEDAWMYTADYDQDGKVDILIQGETGVSAEKMFTCFRNTSDGETFSFEIMPTGFLPLGGTPSRLGVFGDLNADGFLDYVGYGWDTSDGGWPVAVSTSTGLMTYNFQKNNPGITYSEGGVVTFGDLNGDGLIDIFGSGTGNDCDQMFFSKNTTATEPIAIAAPEGVVLSYNTATRQLKAQWNGAVNANGSKNMYNLYLKNETTGQTFMIAPATVETGKQQACTDFGAYVLATDYTFEQVPAGIYTVGVQSVSYSWNASAFTTTKIACLSETEAVAIDQDYEGVQVVMQRSMKGGNWATFCVPFGMSAEQLTANGITEVREFTDATGTGNSRTMIFSKTDHVEAGVPYLVKVDNTVTRMAVEHTNIKAGEPVPVTQGCVKMIGNYETLIIQNNEFFINGNKLYYADHPVTVKGYRAIITTELEAGINSLLFDVDGEVTGIEHVDGLADNAPVNVYSLSGILLRRDVERAKALEGLPAGIYIVNGEKLVKP